MKHIVFAMVFSSAATGAIADTFPSDVVRYDMSSYNKTEDKNGRWKAPEYRHNAQEDEIFCGFTLKPHPRHGRIVINNATFEAFDISQSGVTFGGGVGDRNYEGSLEVVPEARFVKKSALFHGEPTLSDAEWHAACQDKTWSVNHFKQDTLRGSDPLFTGCRPPIYYKDGQANAICWF